MQIIDEQVLNHFFAILKRRGIECHAFSIYQNGATVLEKAFAPFDAGELHPLYSVTKSFTSMAVGFLEEEGRLSIEDAWLSYFPEYEKLAADEAFHRVTIRHLLTMSLGQDCEVEIAGEEDWIEAVLGKELAYEPGAVYFYNSYCSHLLSALVTKLTGGPMESYLKRRLLEPLGITHYLWETDRYGRTLGGYGLHLSVRDLTKFGVCLLHHGAYEGKQILPAAWLEKACSCQISTAEAYAKDRRENRQGYGLHFWMCTRGGYRCSGLHGQLCFVQPENKLVVAMQNATTGSQAVLDSLFEAMEDREEAGKPEFSLPLLSGEAQSGVMSRWVNRTFPAAGNYFGVQSIHIRQEGDCLSLSIVRNHKTYEIKAAYGRWLKQRDLFLNFNTFMTQEGIAPAFDQQSNAAFANYAWKTRTTLAVDIREWDRSCATSLSFEFARNHLVMRYLVNGLYTMLTEAKCIFCRDARKAVAGSLPEQEPQEGTLPAPAAVNET